MRPNVYVLLSWGRADRQCRILFVEEFAGNHVFRLHRADPPGRGSLGASRYGGTLMIGLKIDVYVLILKQFGSAKLLGQNSAASHVPRDAFLRDPLRFAIHRC